MTGGGAAPAARDAGMTRAEIFAGLRSFDHTGIAETELERQTLELLVGAAAPAVIGVSGAEGRGKGRIFPRGRLGRASCRSPPAAGTSSPAGRGRPRTGDDGPTNNAVPACGPARPRVLWLLSRRSLGEGGSPPPDQGQAPHRPEAEVTRGRAGRYGRPSSRHAPPGAPLRSRPEALAVS